MTAFLGLCGVAVILCTVALIVLIVLAGGEPLDNERDAG